MRIFRRKNKEAATGKTPRWQVSVGIYMAVWSLCVLWFWFGMSGGGWIMAYTILSFGVILPVTTLVISFRLEWKQNLGVWRWVSMGFFSVMYVAALWATFVLSTSLGVANIASPSLYTFLPGLCLSAVGIALGWLVRNKKLNPNAPAIGLFFLLAVCYMRLKTINGSFFRPVIILDIPAAISLLILGLWALFRKNKKAGQNGK